MTASRARASRPAVGLAAVLLGFATTVDAAVAQQTTPPPAAGTPAPTQPVATATVPATGAATPDDDRCAPPGEALPMVPWSQDLLEPERAWPLANGSGVTVAVVSSGVDGTHAQLTGRVRPGADFLTGPGVSPADTDCTGLGTTVAGIIAAQPTAAVGFHGVAPGASILPVAVSENQQVGVAPDAAGAGTGVVDAATFAAAIVWAVDAGASVLAIPVISNGNDPRVLAAVADAVDRNVVVVAAAGSAELADDPLALPFPAAYPGVIGVGAVGLDGALAPGSPAPGSLASGFVDLVAPGAGLVSTGRGGGLVQVEGTAIATGFVSAAAALVRSRWPDLPTAGVVQRLLASASPAAAGPDRPEYGHGLVDPYHAVTDALATGDPRSLPGFARSQPDPEELAREARWASSRRGAVLIAAFGGLAAVAVAVAALALPRGRRRGWRPTLADDPGRPSPLDEETIAPPRELFDSQR